MTAEQLTNPVGGDEVPKVDNAVSIGEDLAFQEWWWKFERIIWRFFLLILIADVLGVFGRGWLAKAKVQNPNSGMEVSYERIERAGTPSMMKIRLLPQAVQNGTAQLYVSQSVVQELGAQRLIPQPERSMLSNQGILYSFPAQGGDMEVQFELEPSFPGIHHFKLQVPGKDPVSARVVVVP